MKKKKYLLPLLSTILSIGFLFGCNGNDTGNDTDNGDQDLQEETTNHDQQENQDTNE